GTRCPGFASDLAQPMRESEQGIGWKRRRPRPRSWAGETPALPKERAMDVKELAWLGVQTSKFDEMVGFFRDVMGLPLDVKEPGFAEFGLPNGDKVEVFGPGGPAALDQFASGPIVAGFLVDDIAQARQELIDAGVE